MLMLIETQNGEKWMQQSKAELPIKTVSDIILNITELHEIHNEITSTTMAAKEIFNCDSYFFASKRSEEKIFIFFISD